jgi:hypothetical protein
VDLRPSALKPIGRQRYDGEKLIEVTGRWEDLVNRPEFRGRLVKITIVDHPRQPDQIDEWLQSLERLAAGGVRLGHAADDSRESIY